MPHPRIEDLKRPWHGHQEGHAITRNATLQAPSPVARRNESLRGLAYMAIGIFLFSGVDIQAKYLTETLHPVQITWSRQSGLFLGVVVILAVRGLSVLRTRHPVLQIARGTCAAGSALIFIVAVAYVPIADAVAVSFVAPFLVTAMSALVLREPVGLRRWTAVTIGFLGTLIVIRPGLGVIHPAAFLVIVAAGLFAVRQILSRYLSGADPVPTTVAYTALTATFLLSLPLPFFWQWPQGGTQITVLITIAVMAAAAEIMVIRALEVAQAVVVAPVQYTLMIWGTFYGFMVFGDLPDLWTLVGAGVIIATGLYTLHRERLAHQARSMPS